MRKNLGPHWRDSYIHYNNAVDITYEDTCSIILVALMLLFLIVPKVSKTCQLSLQEYERSKVNGATVDFWSI